ncbi:MAG: hypothetical protein C5B57_11630 [Blastocatellia bacterium]|nr:MAG: hypothetical protein C5B57_11630 [Blastocatellia bacterium]
MCVDVGAASVSITPQPATGLQGYGVRLAEAIDEPLVASAIAIGSEEIDWLLISLDLIGVDRTFTAGIRDALAKRLSMRRDRITLACSHTHSGPASLPRLGPVSADPAYLALLERCLIEVAGRAAADRRSATLRIGVADVQENINRRERRNGRIVLGVDPRGTVDHRVWVGRFDASAGSRDAPIALIVQYACHATCSAETCNVSSDWPGVMRKTLQRSYERDRVQPVVCFLQGCAGDVTHRIGRDRQHWPDHFGAATALEAAIMGRLVAAGAIRAAERAVATAAAKTRVMSQAIALPFRGKTGSEHTEMQIVRIGPAPPSEMSPVPAATWFVFLPGEPLADYGDALTRRFQVRFGAHPNNIVISGYANDAVGYLCTKRALQDGGYEAADAHKVYHRPAPFGADTLSIIQRACTTAAVQLDEPRSQTRSLPAGVRYILDHFRSLAMRQSSRPSTGA